MDTAHTAEHWNRTYDEGERTRSWFQAEPHPSLVMFDAAGVKPADGVIDAGGGASTLVDALLERGFSDVTVLDISAVGMRAAQLRLGPAAERVRWIAADLLDWRPHRTYRVWHDRAVLHFLTADTDRVRYIEALTASTTPGAVAVFGTFAPDGPQQCSALPVARYGVADLTRLLGDRWVLITDDRESHLTPGGVVQPFTWAAFRRTT